MTNGSIRLTTGENLKYARLSGWVKHLWKNISNEDFEVTDNSNSKKDDDQKSIYMKFSQARYETIILDDHPFFDINFMYNDKFFSDESNTDDDEE
ncbi:hypothetical protein RclHR1_20200004 [Rhizophagus clarus]|uniref:Uncharacterized protein n=1 Tax=Rhizophagus clarus TaxID=94130 RepID=A0A2Z6RJE8_9GLOM|nr:hypothetical protein RclHR1_20200004 [Rhizophagus clarus]GES81980.1 hypothetical protein RCL_jg10506.t1 [Rhizophagus clarus]